MSNAEERAFERYPDYRDVGGECVQQIHKRKVFAEGYLQAEKDLTDKARLSSGWDGFYYGQGYKQAKKDLELTWNDIQLIVSLDWDLDHSGFSCGKSTEEYYKEVLKQFNEERNNYNNK